MSMACNRPVRWLLAGVLLLAGGAHAQSVEESGLPETLMNQLRAGRYGEAYPELNRFAARRHALAAYYLGQMYSCGKGVAFSCATAQRYLRQSVQPGATPGWWNDAAKNEIAWIHAACEDTGFTRNGAIALRLARDVTRRSGDPYYADTLAAAQANAGDFGRAVATQRAAIAALEALALQDGAHADAVRVFHDRLSRYEHLRPARFGYREAVIACRHMP